MAGWMDGWRFMSVASLDHVIVGQFNTSINKEAEVFSKTDSEAVR